MNRFTWIRILIQYTLIKKETYLCFSSKLFRSYWLGEYGPSIQRVAVKFLETNPIPNTETVSRSGYLFEPQSRLNRYIERQARIKFLLFVIKNHKRLKHDLQTSNTH